MQDAEDGKFAVAVADRDVGRKMNPLEGANLAEANLAGVGVVGQPRVEPDDAPFATLKYQRLSTLPRVEASTSTGSLPPSNGSVPK